MIRMKSIKTRQVDCRRHQWTKQYDFFRCQFVFVFSFDFVFVSEILKSVAPWFFSTIGSLCLVYIVGT